MSTVTRELANVVVRRRPEDIPAPILDEARRLLLDFLGVGLAGSRAESGRIAAAFAGEVDGMPQATVLGRAERAGAMHAAFANAISSHSVELDDIDEEALYHHAPPVVSAALAATELAGAGGLSMLAAIVAGCETMARLSQATNPALRDRGFHTTPTCGVFGAAVSAGVLLGLSEDQLVSALGLAGAQASGLMEMYGPSMQKRFNPGPAARNGITAVLMARSGFTGAETIVDGERGFARAFAGAFDRERFLAGLGETIPVIVEYKPYSCARPIHNAIDAMLDLRGRGVTVDAVQELTIFRHPSWANYHRIGRPRTFHEAQMSLPYSAAMALATGEALPAQYAQVGRHDDEIMQLSERIVVEADPALSRGVSCRARVRDRAGEVLEATVDYPLGSIQRPLSDAQLEAKFSSLAEESVGAVRAVELAAEVRDLHEATDVSGLVSLLTPEDSEVVQTAGQP